MTFTPLATQDIPQVGACGTLKFWNEWEPVVVTSVTHGRRVAVMVREVPGDRVTGEVPGIIATVRLHRLTWRKGKFRTPRWQTPAGTQVDFSQCVRRDFPRL